MLIQVFRGKQGEWHCKSDKLQKEDPCYDKSTIPQNQNYYVLWSAKTKFLATQQ